MASAEVSGPIDFQQLQLENAELIDVLRAKNSKVINGRKAISNTRKMKNDIKDKLTEEQNRAKVYQRQIADSSKSIPRLKKSLNEIRKRLRIVRSKVEKCDIYLQDSRAQEDLPTLDSYIQLKLDLQKIQWKQKVNQRQKNIEMLRKKNKARKSEQDSDGLVVRRPRPSVTAKKGIQTKVTSKGSLFRGPTFDLMYAMPVTATD